MRGKRNMVDQNDPLSKLYDTSSLQDQREVLADTIFPFARIDIDSLEVRFTQEGELLTVREKLLVYMLTRKALVMGNKLDEEAIAPIELEKATNISGGTIRPVLRKLVDEKLIREENGYLIPNSRIKDVSKILNKKGSKG